MRGGGRPTRRRSVGRHQLRSRRTSTCGASSSGSWNSRTTRKPAFSNALIDAILRLSGSAVTAVVLRAGEDDLLDEAPQQLGAQPASGQRLVGDVEVDTRRALAFADQGRVVRIVGNEVGLDHPERLAVEERQVVVGRLAAVDRRDIVLLGLLERVPRGPPALDVRALVPLVDERKVLAGHRPERDHQGDDRGGTKSVACSRTPSVSRLPSGGS